LNYEHTLVRQGGRDTRGAPVGAVPSADGSNYLVRIDNFRALNRSDLIIDYSKPNIHNVRVSGLFEDFSKKHIYISSSLYEPHFTKGVREIGVLTTFINTEEPRRKQMLHRIWGQNLPHTNVNNCFDREGLRTLYKNTRVMVNIHQTDHHHTFEELRVLPAIQSGVIVICEESPLSHLIPYSEYIIWSTYDNIMDKLNEVLGAYDEYFERIYGDKCHTALKGLDAANYETISTEIRKLLA
jgi:hypothetical protein